MIWNLVLKDIKAFGLQLFIFLILLIALNLFMAANDKSASWWLFILITSGGVSTIIPGIMVLEKKFNGEILSSSLPVTRKQIVISKFLLSGIAAAIGCLFIYLAAAILQSYFNYHDFFVLGDPIMFMIIATYFILFISISVLFATAIRNLIWLIIVDLSFLVVFILGFEKIILPGGISENTNLSNAGFILLIVWIVSLMAVLLVSVKFSIKNYSKMDI